MTLPRTAHLKLTLVSMRERNPLFACARDPIFGDRSAL